MIPANTKHTYLHNPQDPVRKYWCHFDLKFVGEQKLAYHKETLYCVPSSKLVIPLFESLMKLDPSSNILDLLSEKAILIELLKIFIENVSLKKLITESPDDFIVQVNSFILNNLQSPITLKDLADTIHLHPNYFIQYFKKYFSISPMQYVNTVRLEKATQIFMGDPNQSIEAVSYMVGFKDYRYFGRAFKKRYGMPPSTYKNLHSLLTSTSCSHKI